MDFWDTVKKRCGTVFSFVWGKIIDYYSIIPFRRILLFNFTVPFIVRFFIFVCGDSVPMSVVIIAANLIFYGFSRVRAAPGYERTDGKTVLKKLIITVIASFLVYNLAVLGLILFLTAFWSSVG